MGIPTRRLEEDQPSGNGGRTGTAADPNSSVRPDIEDVVALHEFGDCTCGLSVGKHEIGGCDGVWGYTDRGSRGQHFVSEGDGHLVCKRIACLMETILRPTKKPAG
jgi:hypothetical protein